MSDLLEYPDLSWAAGKSLPAIEVSIDFLPDEFQGRWLDVVRQFTADWVSQTGFRQQGTIWMWGQLSVNLVSRHPAHPVPSWSDFLVQVGFPPAYFDALARHVEGRFERQAAVTECLTLEHDAGWAPICHVEDGRTWRPIDEYIWEPFGTVAEETDSD